MRLLIFGNSGSGKSRLAGMVSRTRGIPHLDLDQLAWDPGPKRRPLEESREDITEFASAHPSWVIEGCYGDLIEIAAPYCTELIFLNPGVETCIAHCLARPWEPEKYSSPAAQDEKLPFLLQWVREYETRDDEFSLARHRSVFESFSGAKREVSTKVDFLFDDAG